MPAFVTLVDRLSIPGVLANPRLPSSGTILLATAIAAYLLLVRSQRWRSYNAIHAKYAHKIDKLTPFEAQEIVRASEMWDMPTLLFYAQAFALMRTYCLPTISRILMQTRELKSPDTVSKRFLDTSILAATMSLCPIASAQGPLAPADNVDITPDDPRGYIAIARTNWLHSHYPILNEDFLYTLSLFIREPIRWSERYGWRLLSPLECEARFVVWKSIGEHMHFKDIPQTLEAMCEWSDTYEEGYAVPDQANHDLTSGMLAEFVHPIPSVFGLRNFVLRVIYALYDDRIREALMFPAQPAWIHAIVRTGMGTIAFVQRYLLLPRQKPMLIVPLDVPTAPPKDGKLARMHPEWRSPKPWYEPPRTGIARIWEKIGLTLGFVKPENVPGPQYRSDGYRLEEIGPLRWENAGHAQVLKQAGELRGCPVTGVWAREVAAETTEKN